jgi:hypothetical protein
MQDVRHCIEMQKKELEQWQRKYGPPSDIRPRLIENGRIPTGISGQQPC